MPDVKNSLEKILTLPASNGYNLTDYDASLLVPEKSQMEVIIKNMDQGNGGSVLVTGAAGFIGSNLCRTLLEQGSEVYAVDNLITGRFENIVPFLDHKKFHFLKLDIIQPAFRKMFHLIRVNEIYDLACPTGVPNIKIMGEEMILTNSLGTLHIMELARRHQARVLFTSSAEIYGQPEVTPQHESYNGNVNPLGPRSAYEEGKRFSESIVRMYADKYNVNAKIVRIFNTYGPGMSLNDQRVMPQFLLSIRSGKNLVIYGNGEQTRTFLYIDDLIRGLTMIMAKGNKGEAYNIGGEEQITIKQLALILKELTDYQNEITFSPHFIEDHQRRQPQIAKVQNLGWQQTINLKQGLQRMLSSNGIKHNGYEH